MVFNHAKQIVFKDYFLMAVFTTNPQLTIIVPTFNSEATLRITMRSIVNQTFQDYDVLIIDGASKDRTMEIVRKFQTEHQNIKIFQEPDHGIYDAMNKGISLSSGKWLYFLGSDDSFYEPTTLEQIFQNKQLLNSDVIYGNVKMEGLNKVYDGEFNYSKLTTKNICHQAIFFNRKIFKKIGNFNLKYKALADWDHNLRWFFSSKVSKVYTDQIIANYASGGFSMIYQDEAFYRDKNSKLLWKGIGKIELSSLISLSRNAIAWAKKDNSFIQIGFWTSVKNSFLLVRRIKKYKSSDYYLH